MNNADIAAGSIPAGGNAPTMPMAPGGYPGALVRPEQSPAPMQGAAPAQMPLTQPAGYQASTAIQAPPQAQVGPQMPAQTMVTGDTRGFSLAPNTNTAAAQVPTALPAPGSAPQPGQPANGAYMASSQPVQSQAPAPAPFPVPPQAQQAMQAQMPSVPAPNPGSSSMQAAPTALVPGAPMLDTISPAPAPAPVPAPAPSVAPVPAQVKAPGIPAPAPVSSKASKRSSLAVAALIVGIMAVVLEIFISNLTNFIIAVAPVSLAAIGLGVPALGSPRRGLAIAGVVLGSLSLVSVIILFSVNLATQSRCQLNPGSDPQCQAVTTQSTGVGQ